MKTLNPTYDSIADEKHVNNNNSYKFDIYHGKYIVSGRLCLFCNYNYSALSINQIITSLLKGPFASLI